MNLPTEHPTAAFPNSVGLGGEDGAHARGSTAVLETPELRRVDLSHAEIDALATFQIARLAVPVEWNRFCERCEVEVKFVADRFCIAGLIGECTGCGDERIAPFTRANSEVA
jgi:hypothetical protein